MPAQVLVLSNRSALLFIRCEAALNTTSTLFTLCHARINQKLDFRSDQICRDSCILQAH